MNNVVRFILLLASLFLFISCQYMPFWEKTSSIQDRLYDENAVFLNTELFPANADGETDDSAVIQAAIDYVEQYHDYGIVFVPSGDYAIHHTINLWRGIRLIGYGKKRPRFILNDHTPGFQDDTQYLVHFRGRKPVLGQSSLDVVNTIQFSGIRNVDIEIGSGNQAAIAVRFLAGQMTSLESMDFVLHSGTAAIDQTGSQIYDCSFTGGDYALISDGPVSKGPALVLNCRFDGQTRACVLTNNSGLTFISCLFQGSPYAINVAKNSTESVYIRNSQCTDISVSTLLLDQYSNPSGSVNIYDLQCGNTPNLLLFRDRNTPISGNTQFYRINELSHGLLLDYYNNGITERSIKTKYRYQALEKVTPETYPVPEVDLSSKICNILDYGATGDGYSDDTVAFIKAIRDHKTIYIPQGNYIISSTIKLAKNTNLIGLHPRTTKIILQDYTPEFSNSDSTKPMLMTPPGGNNIISGIGFDAGSNPGAVQVLWQAKKSALNDAWFERGGMADQQIDFEFPYSLWVKDGGAGLFRNVWLCNMQTQTGLFVQNSRSRATIMLMTLENNSKNLVFENSGNWSVYAMHCMEHMGRQDALMIDLNASQHIDFSQLYITREISAQKHHNYGIRLRNNSSTSIQGLYNFSWGQDPFDNAFLIADRDHYISEPQIALIEIK